MQAYSISQALAALVLENFGSVVLRRVAQAPGDLSQCLGCRHFRAPACDQFLRGAPPLFFDNVLPCPDREP